MAQRKERKGIPLWLPVLVGLWLLGKRVARAPRKPGMGTVDACGEFTKHAIKSPRMALLQKRLVRRLARMGDGLRVLDIGCGAGHLAVTVAGLPNVASVTGIDLSSELLDAARANAQAANAHADFLQADGADLPFSEGTFDVVVSTLSLHHWENPEGVVREARRVLAPNGTLLLFDLRRDGAAPIVGGLMAFSWVMKKATGKAEGFAESFTSAFLPWEAALLMVRAGFREPQVETFPLTMVITVKKAASRK